MGGAYGTARRVLIVAVTLSCIVAVGGAEAAGRSLVFINGNKLFEMCQTADVSAQTSQTFKDGTCAGYILGVADALGGSSFCFAVEMEVGQLVDVVKLYLRDHPERRHYTAASLIVDAFTEKFSCSPQ